MEKQVDIAVIGGGAIGLFAAHFLRQQGCSVVVLDKGEIGMACSHGNAGYVSPSHVIPLAAPGVVAKGLRWMFQPDSPFYVQPRADMDLLRWLWLFRNASTKTNVERAAPVLKDLSLASVAHYRTMQESGLDLGFAPTGLLMAYRTEAGRRDNKELAQVADEVGLDVRTLDADAVQALEPAVKPGLEGIFFPQDAVVDPARMTEAMHRQLEAAGVLFKPSTEVLGFVRRNGSVTSLQTSRGEIAAEEVVLAAGSWTPGLTRALGLRLPVQPAKGYSVTYSPRAGRPRIPVLLTEAKVAVTPLPGNRLRFAGTLELAGLNPSLNTRRVQAILDAAPRYLTGVDLEGLDPVDAWHGFRPCTPDGLPFIGRPRGLSNVMVATGHAMMGITLAPATGQLVAELLMGQTPFIDPHPLRVTRFA